MDGLGPQVPEATTSSFTDVIESEPADGEGDTNVTEGEVKVENSGNKADDKAKVTVPKTEQELLFCKFCEFQGVDLEAYFKHVHKPSHIKRAAEAYKIRLTKDTTPTHFHCQECLISCNGENAWNQHLLGQKHRKVLEKKSAQLAELQKQRIGGGPMKTNYFGNTANRKPYEKVNRTVQQPSHNPTQALGAQDFANYAAPLIGLEYVTEIQVIGQSPRYQCSLCDAKFDHNLKFPHLVGAKHRMNVLKIKRPQVLQDSRNQTQKRSELTAMLLREARKLEEEEGRQQVKTRVEKSPFAAANISFQASAGRGGITPRGVPGARGGPGGRGSRGGRGGTGVSSRGNRGTFGGNRGMTRGNRGSPGRGNRGSPRGRGQAWSGTYNYYDDLDQTFSRPPSQYDSSPYYNDYSDDYLPYNASNDTYRPMDTYEQRAPEEATPSAQAFAGKALSEAGGFTKPVKLVVDHPSRIEAVVMCTRDQPRPGCLLKRERERERKDPGSDRMLPKAYDEPSPYSQSSQIPGPSGNFSNPESSKFEDPRKQAISSTLAGALGDLTKLVQNEDDASVALHVSNALTQALLQYRMVNDQDEGSS